VHEGKAFMMGIAVFVVDGHDINLYPDADAAALSVEGYDAMRLDYLGADGTVYEAIVEGPQWGPVRLHRTQETRLDELIHLLWAEAEYRGLRLPPETPGVPETIWTALLAAQENLRTSRRARRRWWTRPAD
jgi:hypothetical protein